MIHCAFMGKSGRRHATDAGEACRRAVRHDVASLPRPFVTCFVMVCLVPAGLASVNPTAPISVAPDSHQKSPLRVGIGQNDVLALQDVISDIVGQGSEYLNIFADASRHGPWVTRHGQECAEAADRLRKAWFGVQRMISQWRADGPGDQAHHAEHRAEERPSGGAHPGSKDQQQRHGEWRKYLESFLCFGLVVVALAAWNGKQPLNLFSIDVHSPVEVAIAFVLASLVAFLLVEHSGLGRMANNPFILYFMQVLISFLAATTTVPILLGGRHDSSILHAVVALGANFWFAAMWLVSDFSILFFISSPSDALINFPGVVSAALMVTILNLALLLTTTRKMLYGCRHTRVQPFYRRYVQECLAYAEARVRAPGLGAQIPTRLPAALLAVVAVGATVMSILILSLAFIVSEESVSVTRFVVDVLINPLQPVYRWAGVPVRADAFQALATRVTVCVYAALTVGAVYTVWLIGTVFHGYRTVFKALAEGKPFQGRELATKHGDAVFQAKWGTYCTGAFVGNVLFGFGVVVLLALLLLLVLTQKEFWELLWSAWAYWTLYMLLYVTRQAFFRIIIPKYVVTDGGTVLRRRVWGLLYGTLMITNLILGATNGLIRTAVMLPYLIAQFFRIDITYLPDGLTEWDWAFQPFMCLVMHAHQQMNPIMIAAVAKLNPQGLYGVLADKTPTNLNVTSLCGVPVDDVPSELGAASVDVLADNTPGELDNPATRRSSRARNRWFLYITLARNPSLRLLRGHVLPQNSGQMRSDTDLVSVSAISEISAADVLGASLASVTIDNLDEAACSAGTELAQAQARHDTANDTARQTLTSANAGGVLLE